MKRFLLLVLIFVQVIFNLTLSAQSEQLLVDETFQSWAGFTATTSNPSLVVNQTTLISGESLVYTMHGVSVLPTGYASGASANILSTAGCLRMQKNTEVVTEGTPMSIVLSPLQSITKIWFVECTTGSNRGFQVWKKNATDADWVSIHNAVCNPSSGMAIPPVVNSNSSYELTIPAGAFKNGSNTPTASETKVNYKTPDTIFPILTKISVNDDSTLPVNGFISLVMSEPCQAGPASINIGSKTITAAVSASNANLIYINYSGLAYDTEYTVVISENAIIDLSGNAYAGKVFSFRTEVDAKGSLLLNFIPDATSVPSSTVGTMQKILNTYPIEFGGVASAGIRNAATYTYAFKCNYVQLPALPSVGELIFYIQSGGGATPQEYYIQKLAADGTTWQTIETFILGNNDRNYVKSAAAQSSIPTTLRLLYNSAQLWFFDMQVYAFADNSPVDDGQIPTIVSTNPVAASTDVAINGNIKLIFSENIRLGTGNITLDGKILTPGIVGKHITLPYSNLKYATNYTLNVPAGAFQDAFNNDCEAFVLNFTTRAKPAVTSQLFNFVVAADGSGNGVTIQSAFDAVPLNNASNFLIFVKDGIYNEYPTLARTKNHVSLIGQSRNGVIITGNRRSGVDGYTTSTCQTMEIMGNEFYCENMTFQNTAGVSAGQGNTQCHCSSFDEYFEYLRVCVQ